MEVALMILVGVSAYLLIKRKLNNKRSKLALVEPVPVKNVADFEKKSKAVVSQAVKSLSRPKRKKQNKRGKRK